MSDDLPTYIDEREAGVAWLKGVLGAILEVAPLSYKQKKVSVSFLNKMPEWLMAKWADSLNIDYAGGCTMYPNMAEQAHNYTGKYLVQQYLESRDAVLVGHGLEQLVRTVKRQANERNLPENYEIIEKQVGALALAGCNAEGGHFNESAIGILNDNESSDHPLIEYQRALMSEDSSKIKALNDILCGDRYGVWIAERLNEMKRYLGLEPPHFTVRTGERTPQWDLLWQKIFVGGDEN
ncbi:MAG: hypothetical protein AAC990_06100 [Dehalococcoides mccartyi]|uniref:hypothetical protein n=1 Tax=Dehalococcoides mccartyi TaxID=61435 RepID=UPI0030F93CEE